MSGRCPCEHVVLPVRHLGLPLHAPTPGDFGHRITDRDGVISCVACHKTWARAPLRR